MFCIILEPRNTSHMWYLNTPANSLKLAFEMAEKLSQKVKNAKWLGWLLSSPRDTINFGANGLMIHLATYIIKHVACGGQAPGPKISGEKITHYPTPWGIEPKL